jgi:uncharacterized membrane protein YkoI
MRNKPVILLVSQLRLGKMNLLRYSTVSAGLISLLVQSASIGQQQDPSATATNTSAGEMQSTYKTKVSIDEARKIAQSNAKGEIIHEKLDKVADRVCFAFDIKDGGDVKQVLVDGLTGQVVIVENVPPSPTVTPHLKMPILRPH